MHNAAFFIGKRPPLNETNEVVMLPADERATLIFPTYISSRFQPASIQHNCMQEAANGGAGLLHATLYIWVYLEHLFKEFNVLNFLELSPNYSCKMAHGF